MFKELLTCFSSVTEPRQAGKVEHRLADVLAITVCAVLTHAESFEDIEIYAHHKEKWLRQGHVPWRGVGAPILGRVRG